MEAFGPYLIGIGTGMLMLVLLYDVMGGTYKDGQIDCIEGKIYYEAVEEKSWQKIIPAPTTNNFSN